MAGTGTQEGRDFTANSTQQQQQMAHAIALELRSAPKSPIDQLREWLPTVILLATLVTTFVTLRVQVQEIDARLHTVEENYVPLREHERIWAGDKAWKERVDSKLDRLLDEERPRPARTR